MNQRASNAITRHVWQTVNKNRARIQQSQDAEERERAALRALNQKTASAPGPVNQQS